MENQLQKKKLNVHQPFCSDSRRVIYFGTGVTKKKLFSGQGRKD